MTYHTVASRIGALCLALALSGCASTGSSHTSGPSSTDQAATGQPAGVPASSGSVVAAATAGVASTLDVPKPLVAERTATDAKGNVVAFAPVTLRRQGDLVVLELGVRNITPPSKGDDDYNIVFVFMLSSAEFDGVSLVDVKNHKRHVVVTDSKDHCLCTSFSGGLAVPHGGSTVLTAYFAAPPPDVATMDVALAKRGSFLAIPLS